MEKISINGVEIFGFPSKNALIEFVDAKKGILVAINARKIDKATDKTRQIINSNIGYADGLGAVAALHKAGLSECPKIAGCELWLDIIRKYQHDKTFYFIGATDEVINATIKKLREEFPGLKIIGYRNGFLKSDSERETLIEQIAQLKPDVVFVAMGSPRQELLMAEMLKRHPAIYQGLGGSFKVYCGEDKRAPEWWVRHNLEGPYRVFFVKGRPGGFQRLSANLWFLLRMKLGLIKIKKSMHNG